MNSEIFTIGHSNRSIESFLAQISNSAIGAIVDVRSYPKSSRHPHFDKENLRTRLGVHEIDYHWFGRAMGGMRKSPVGKRHSALANPSFKAYAAHMESTEFGAEIDALEKLAHNTRVCLMCAEANVVHCHRQFIADFLVVRGWSVKHIQHENDTFSHRLSPNLNVESSQLVYNKNSQQELF
ncbi:MAG: DUF488 domain-containing protein [Pseudomonadota bacterium]